MFKINIYLRLAIIALCFILTAVLWPLYGFVYVWPFLFTGIILLIGYLAFGTITSAGDMVQKMNFEGAEKRLKLTLTPKLLYVTNRAFYYILNGALAMNKKDMQTAEALFDRALNMKLPSDNEKAMVLLQLANINATRNKWNPAKRYYREAKQLKITESQLKEQMAQFEKALSNRGQMKLASTMGKQGMQMMKGMGSKRRRPKMR